MQRREVEGFLAQLGQELDDLGIQKPVRILLIGGAFIQIQIDSRRMTDDIDVLFKDIDNVTNSTAYQAFKVAVRTIATKNGLKGNWINDVMSDFLWDIKTVPVGTLWRRFGQLEVFLPPQDYVLALKLLAGRPKDKRDIEMLCQKLKVRTREQAQQLVDRYIPDKRLQLINELEDTLDEIF